MRCAHLLLWFGVPDPICCLGSCAQEQANNSIRNVTEWESGVGCSDSLKAKAHRAEMFANLALRTTIELRQVWAIFKMSQLCFSPVEGTSLTGHSAQIFLSVMLRPVH